MTRALSKLFVVQRLGRKGARWTLDAEFRGVEIPEGYVVEHCGHPTANRPYIGIAPDGGVIYAPNGLGFRFLHEAMHAVAERAIADLGKEKR